jgi:hypothetical protein
MEIRGVDFFLGMLLGLGLGAGLVMAIFRVRSWLGRSEAGRLGRENRDLKRRLAEKDRHINRMLSETERLAERLGQGDRERGKEMLEEGARERSPLPPPSKS